MSACPPLTLSLRTPEDIVQMRRTTRDQAIALDFSLVEQTKIVTAASEIGRNTILYGGGGEVTLQPVRETARRGLLRGSGGGSLNCLFSLPSHFFHI